MMGGMVNFRHGGTGAHGGDGLGGPRWGGGGRVGGGGQGAHLEGLSEWLLLSCN